MVPHDSTALLNQLRLEEKERERELRKQQILEKQKEREEFEQTLQSWEDELLEQPIKDYMRTMWEVWICCCDLQSSLRHLTRTYFVSSI